MSRTIFSLRKLVFIVLLCLLAPLASRGQVGAQPPNNLSQKSDASPPMSVTIVQALEEAVQNNLSLLAQRLDLSIAEANLITARLRPNPVFSFSSDHLDALGTGFNETNGAGPSEISARVDVPFERGGKRELRVDTADYEKEIAEARLEDEVRKLKLDVTLACIELIQNKTNLALANSNLQTFEQVVSVNTARVNAGSIAPLELTRSRAAMLQFRNSVKQAELPLAAARVKVQSLIGRKTFSASFDVADELKVPLSAADLQLSSLQQSALSFRPDVRMLTLSQARSQYELKLQLANGKVDFTYGAEYRRQQGINGTGNSLGVFFSAPVPLYNRNQGEIARVQAEQTQLDRQMQATNAQILAEVNTAYQEFVAAREMVQSIEGELLGPAQQARDTAFYVYSNGGSSLLEFLDAQRALNDTMLTYQQAQAEYRRATVQLNATVNQEVVQP